MSRPVEISHEKISEQFYYDKDTDLLMHRRLGYRGGRKTDHLGYIRRYVNGRALREHRIVYLLNNPDMDQSLQIDHINGNRTDNRLANLRLVTATENQCNMTGAWGFYWVVPSKKWRATIQVGGKNIDLGTHNNKLDARAAYLRAKKIYHVIEER